MGKVLLTSFLWLFLIVFIHSQVVIRSAACDSNETYAECAHCGPRACRQLGYPVPCAGATRACRQLGYPVPCAGATRPCRPGCVCVDGFLRDANGTCIPNVDCPSCGEDPNAMAGCGNHCGNTCSDYMLVNKTCFSGCRYNGCDCRPGHVFHEGTSKCVLKENC